RAMTPEAEVDSKAIECAKFKAVRGCDPSRAPGEKHLKAADELGITPLQAWAVDLLVEGLSNKAMAKRMGTTEYVVKEQVSAVLTRFGRRSRVQVILHLDQHRLELEASQCISVTPEELGLTARQGSVLALLMEGLSNECIALRLGLATSTVK